MCVYIATKNGATLFFTGHRFPFTFYSWRINLCEWHSQRTSRLLPELASAFLSFLLWQWSRLARMVARLGFSQLAPVVPAASLDPQN